MSPLVNSPIGGCRTVGTHLGRGFLPEQSAVFLTQLHASFPFSFWRGTLAQDRWGG